jgi:bud site selection protein 20
MPAIRGADSKKKTRRMTRGIDQIALDITNPTHLAAYKSYKGDVSDLPGGGLHYCVECAKWFDSAENLGAHGKGKVHKRRVKELREQVEGAGWPSQREAEEATGLGRDDGVVTRREKEEKAQTQEMEVEDAVTG